MWKHTGGGCMVVGNEPLPCDDGYRNDETGEDVYLRCTPEVHFKLPHEVAELSELEALGAVVDKTADCPT